MRTLLLSTTGQYRNLQYFKDSKRNEYANSYSFKQYNYVGDLHCIIPKVCIYLYKLYFANAYS